MSRNINFPSFGSVFHYKLDPKREQKKSFSNSHFFLLFLVFSCLKKRKFVFVYISFAQEFLFLFYFLWYWIMQIGDVWYGKWMALMALFRFRKRYSWRNFSLKFGHFYSAQCNLKRFLYYPFYFTRFEDLLRGFWRFLVRTF